MLLLKMRIVSLAQKFLFFSKIKSTIIVRHPKGLTWHLIETKAIKHDYYSSIIIGHTKTLRINIGLSPNKRFSLMPF